MNTDRTVALLKETALFSGMEERALAELAGHASVRTFPKGALIFYQGDPGDSVFILAEGSVKVFIASDQGEEMVLTTLRPPDALGEVALLDQGGRSASAEALEPVTAIAFARSTLLELMHSLPGIGDAVLRSAGALLRRLTGQAADLVFLDLEGRVAKLLVGMAEQRGEERDGLLTLDLGITQSDLAAMVGGSRQSVNQILQTLANRGFLEVEGRHVTIRQPDALRRRAGL
ncbi:MAG: Crp/Fnr family transcriptional regulator [Actinomycetota bacterium]|nr:Crp/Fnr family transcriptional regulator [Actinomycetota bacterium]